MVKNSFDFTVVIVISIFYTLYIFRQQNNSSNIFFTMTDLKYVFICKKKHQYDFLNIFLSFSLTY